MQEPNTVTKGLFIIQGVLATVVAGLMFYPMFGGTLMILNGTFIYFSYFLAIFLIAILAIIDIVQLFIIRKSKNESVQKSNFLAFVFISLMVMIGLLEGHYIFSPLLAIVYIFLMIMQLFQIIGMQNEKQEFYQTNIFDIIQKVFFYFTAIIFLLGNQPFELWGIPVATTALFVLVAISVVNFVIKMRKI